MPDSLPSISQEVSMLSTLPFDEFVDSVVNKLVTFTINLAIAVFVFYLGRFVINKIYSFVSGLFHKRKLDASLATFILSMVRIVLYFILIVTVIGILGIETSSFIALFASAGVAIGMALSGTLQNFAGGVLILLLKPYKVGDYIEAQGYAGTVCEIQIFHTIICTADNKSIIIPNGGLSTGSINNWSREDYRRVDWTISIAYGDDIETARKRILDILLSEDHIVKTTIADHRTAIAPDDEEILQDELVDSEDSEHHQGAVGRFFTRRKEKIEHIASTTVPKESLTSETDDKSPLVRVSSLAASSVDLKVTAWAPTVQYWTVFFRINERIYTELPCDKVHFPFPQLDVHINPN